jgi:20S proteasome alpha/beta subunit
MTIGVGFRFADGILLGTDEQVTYDTELKTAGSKIAISSLKRTGYSLVMAGAGHLGHLEKLWEMSTRTLDRGKKTHDAARGLLEKVVRRLFLDVVCPYDATHAASDGMVEALIAFRGTDGEMGFWKTATTTLVDAEDCECIGSGAISGTFFASKNYRVATSYHEAVVIMTDILRLTKDFNPYCSGTSEIVGIHGDGRVSEKLENPVRDLENFLKGYDVAVRDAKAKCANPDLPAGEIDKELRLLCDRIKGLRQDIETPLAKALRGFFGKA